MNPKLQAIIDQIRSNPEYKKNLQNALTNPEGSDTFEDALRSMNGVIADARNIIVNDKALDAIKDEFVPPMAEEDPFVRLEGDELNDYMGLLYQGEDGKEAVDDFILDKKIQDGMDRGQQEWFNEAFTPHAMDYLTVDDISDPTQVAIKKYRDSEADKFFDKAIDQDTSKGVGRAAGLFQAYKELSDPAKRRYIPNAAPLEDVGDTTPEEDLAHYEEALKVLQERKANRAKSLENARAQMAGAAWMYRKDPSMLAALFSEKSAKDIAKIGKESQQVEKDKDAKKKIDRAYNALVDEVEGYDAQDKEQTKLIKKLAREYRNALEDADIFDRFDGDMEALGVDMNKLWKNQLDWKSGVETSTATSESPSKPVLVSDINNFLDSEQFKDLKKSFKKTTDVDSAIKLVDEKINSLESNSKDSDTDKAKARQDLENLKTKLDQRKKDIIADSDSTIKKKNFRKSNTNKKFATKIGGNDPDKQAKADWLKKAKEAGWPNVKIQDNGEILWE